MNARTQVTDASMRAMNAVHRALLALSGGRIGWRAGRMVVVELHTVGRKSGARRSTMLTAPISRDGRYVLVASKGGDDRNPDWYENLRANADVELTARGTTACFRARTASDAEKRELWPEIVAAYPGYAAYQRRTSRNIPLVICDPVGGNAQPG
ncbi:MAG TPA: nitroreductase/quinone reductase family protein [Mycetocola sp.]|jgi:deazaflavin-dependent oxidoreductase (nitroreductase family)|nr:nitroreductase/quinone reductase family protein [Mycetocola sp.]